MRQSLRNYPNKSALASLKTCSYSRSEIKPVRRAERSASIEPYFWAINDIGIFGEPPVLVSIQYDHGFVVPAEVEESVSEGE